MISKATIGKIRRRKIYCMYNCICDQIKVFLSPDFFERKVCKKVLNGKLFCRIIFVIESNSWRWVWRIYYGLAFCIWINQTFTQCNRFRHWIGSLIVLTHSKLNTLKYALFVSPFFGLWIYIFGIGKIILPKSSMWWWHI